MADDLIVQHTDTALATPAVAASEGAPVTPSAPLVPAVTQPASTRAQVDTGFTPEVTDTIASYFGATPGVSSSGVDLVGAYVAEIYGPGAKPLGDVKVAHPYHLDDFGFSDDARRYADHFGNIAAARGISDGEFYAVVRRYVDELSPAMQQQVKAHGHEQVEVTREVQAQDLKDRDSTREAMRAEWGFEFYTRNVRTITAYLNRLPEAERTRIENEVLPSGKLALNDPDRLRELLHRAQSAAPSTPANTTATTPAQSNDVASMTRADIEAVMHKDRTRYNRSPEIQARYLALLRSEESGIPMQASSGNAVEREIAEIENFMRTNRAAYNRDEVKRARLLALYRLRDG